MEQVSGVIRSRKLDKVERKGSRGGRTGYITKAYMWTLNIGSRVVKFKVNYNPEFSKNETITAYGVHRDGVFEACAVKRSDGDIVCDSTLDSWVYSISFLVIGLVWFTIFYINVDGFGWDLEKSIFDLHSRNLLFALVTISTLSALTFSFYNAYRIFKFKALVKKISDL